MPKRNPLLYPPDFTKDGTPKELLDLAHRNASFSAAAVAAYPLLEQLRTVLQDGSFRYRDLSLSNLISLGTSLQAARAAELENRYQQAASFTRANYIRAYNLPNDHYRWVKYGEKRVGPCLRAYFRCCVANCNARRYAFYDANNQIYSAYVGEHNHENYTVELYAQYPRDLLLCAARASLYCVGYTRLNGFGETFDERANFNFPLVIQCKQEQFALTTGTLPRRRVVIACSGFAPTAEMLGFNTVRTAARRVSHEQLKCKVHKCLCTVTITDERVTFENAHNHHPMLAFNKEAFLQERLYYETEGTLVYSTYAENDVYQKLRQYNIAECKDEHGIIDNVGGSDSDEDSDASLQRIGIQYPHL